MVFRKKPRLAGAGTAAEPPENRRLMRPTPAPELQRLTAALREHGAKCDLIQSRAAFAEKRAPRFKGWDDPEDRYRLPSLDTLES